MITSCLQSPETPKFSLNSLRRGNAPINAVLSKNIPSETLTPLKDLVKYKYNNLNDNNNTNSLEEHLSPKTECCKNEMSSLRSTIIAGYLDSDNISVGSDEKANEHEATFFPKEEVFKRNKTFEIVAQDSPAKIFQRMKTRALEATQRQLLKDTISLELQRSQRDVILSPVSLHKSRLDKTFISGFPDFHKVSDDHSFSGRIASSLSREAALINFQSKFFLPVKQKIPHQQENLSCHHNLTYDITTSKERHENISTSVILSEALASSARLIQDDENRVTSVEFSLSDTLVLENIDADDERSQSPNINDIRTDCVPANTGRRLSKSDSEVPSKALLKQEMSEENEEKISKTTQQGSTSDMFKVLTTASKARIVAPEKKVPKISTNKNSFTSQKKEICLQKWMIRNMNNNTAVCVEGKLIDTPDLYWHSNAIVERLDYNRLRTVSGNIYVLKGTIDTISMKEAGFPASFTRKFIFGFPKKWKHYVDDLLQELRALTKKEKKCKLDQQETDKSVFEMKMKRSDTSKETGAEMVSKSARTKNTTYTTYDVSENSEISTDCNALRRATELNVFHTDQRHKIPFKLHCGEQTNCDNQMNVTSQPGRKNCLLKEESTSKIESKPMTSPKKTKNHEAKTNETVFKSLKRVRKNVAKDITQELIDSSDTQSSKEEFFSDIEKVECVNNRKKLTVMLTPMNSRKTLEQKCKDHNLRTDTIKKFSDLVLPNHKVEYGGNKSYLRKNKNNKLLRSLEKTFGSGLVQKSEDEEDTGIYASVTINQKIKMPSPPKERSSTSDSERKIKRSLRLKSIEPSGNILPYKTRTKMTEMSSQDSETEEESRKKAPHSMKMRQKDTKETVVNQSKCKRKDTRKSPVTLEHESEESDKDFHPKTRKPTSSNKTVQKIRNRRKFSSAEVMGSRKTKDQPLECFPDLIKEDNWTEKELQKFQGALSSVPKQKHGFWLNVATAMGPRTAEESPKKHLEEPQGRGSRKRAIKKMVPRPKASIGAGVDTDTNQPVRITARVGTLKRKQQMRDFLEQLPKDDHDDMFSGSPLHNRRIQLPNFEVSQDDDFPHMDRDPTTPSSVIYPLAKTPQCQHVSPGMLESINRKDCDKYVFQMQKENKSHGGMVWANVRKKLVGSDFTTPTSRRVPFNKGIKSDIGKLFSHTTRLNFDEEEQDDYFSNSDSAE